MTIKHAIKKIHITPNIVFDLILILVITYLLFVSTDVPMRTRRLPVAVMWLTILFCVMQIGMTMLKQIKDKSEEMALDKKVVLKAGGAVLFLIGTVLLWPLLGFVITSLLVIPSFMIYLGAKNKFAVILSVVALTGIVYLIFGVTFNIPLPKGILF